MALPNAEIMIHQPSAGTQGQITDMAIHLKRLEVIKKRMNRHSCGKHRQAAGCGHRRLRARQFHDRARRRMEYGLIDKVIDKR